MLYSSDGTIRKLTDITQAERRRLAEEEEQGEEEDMAEHHRSLALACEDCYVGWDLWCSEGWETSKNLFDSGLVPEGTALTAVEYLVTGNYWICYNAYEAEEGCDDQCV